MKGNRTRSNARKKTVRNKNLKLKESQKLYDAIPLNQILQLTQKSKEREGRKKGLFCFERLKRQRKESKLGSHRNKGGSKRRRGEHTSWM